MKPIQQGDVFIEPCGEIPSGRMVDSVGGRFVLAEGEATGHAHVIEDVAGIKFVEKDGKFYLQNKIPATVKHEEHRPITIPPGTWRVKRVREYDHFAEEARAVAD